MKKFLIPALAAMIAATIFVSLSVSFPSASEKNITIEGVSSDLKNGTTDYKIQFDSESYITGTTNYLLAKQGQQLWLALSILEDSPIQFDQEEDTVTLQYNNTNIILSAGVTDYVMNDTVYLFSIAPEIYKSEFYIPSDVFRLLNFLVDTDFLKKDYLSIAAHEGNQYEDKTREIVEYLIAGEHEEYYNMATEGLQSIITLEEMENEWEFVTESIGDFRDIHSYKEFFRTNNDGQVLCESEVVLRHTIDGVVVRIQYFENEISRIFFFPHAKPMPNAIIEENVIIGEETEFPLGATLTLPKGDGPFHAVVLAHGSGSADRDYSSYLSYKPFRDIAWGLAEQGIAVLRYDKRMHTYPEEVDENPEFTIREEVIEDILLATELLRLDERIQDVSLLGHSLGGSVAAVIDEEADFASIVSFAGALRPLWDIGLEQMQYFQKTATDEDSAAAYERRYNLMKGYGSLLEMDNAMAKTEMLGEFFLYYYKDFMRYDLFNYAQRSTKPFLILQGTTDFQVSPTIDFPLWKEALKDNLNAEFILYENVNHVFMESPENNRGTLQEYIERKTAVPDYIIDDIAAFLKNVDDK